MAVAFVMGRSSQEAAAASTFLGMADGGWQPLEKIWPSGDAAGDFEIPFLEGGPPQSQGSAALGIDRMSPGGGTSGLLAMEISN
jgi:hypothetical protein